MKTIKVTLKFYLFSENDSSMQNVVPSLILIMYSKFKCRYHFVNGILSKTFLLSTDKVTNSGQWMWFQKRAKRGLISKLFLCSNKEIFHNETKLKNRSVLCLVFAHLQLFLKSKLTNHYKWNYFLSSSLIEERIKIINQYLSVLLHLIQFHEKCLFCTFLAFSKELFFSHSISNIWLTNALKFCTDKDVSNALFSYWERIFTTNWIRWHISSMRNAPCRHRQTRFLMYYQCTTCT